MGQDNIERYLKLKEEFEKMKKANETIITQKPIDFAEEVRKLHEEEECNQTTDEQAKKIKSQKKEIKHLNKLLASRNKEIWDLKDEVKNLVTDLGHQHKIIQGKEFLLNKYRINDHIKEEMIAALRKKLAENVVNKVDENALKSAESALAYKDEVIEKLTKKYERLKKNISDAVDILDEKDEETPSCPTEDNPDEVSLADMVKIVIEAFFDGKSVIIK